MRVRRDRHHILHTGMEWNLRPETRSLRETPQLVPLIDRQVHDEIHRIAPAVPLLSYYVMKRTVSRFEPQPTTIRSLDNLMICIEEAANHRRAHPLERDLAHVAINALDIQRAILRGNVIEPLEFDDEVFQDRDRLIGAITHERPDIPTI